MRRVLPLLATAGIALAALPAVASADPPPPGSTWSQATITEPDVLLAELERVRRQGFAVDDGEEETGVRCLAVPVRDGTQVVAAVSVSGPAGRLSPDDLPALAARLQPVADELGRELAVGGSRARRATVLG